MLQSREMQMLTDVHETVFRPETGVRDKLTDLHHHHSHTRERLEKMEKYIEETTKGRKHMVVTILVALLSSAVAVGVAISNRDVNEQKMKVMVEAVTEGVMKSMSPNHIEEGNHAP